MIHHHRRQAEHPAPAPRIALDNKRARIVWLCALGWVVRNKTVFCDPEPSLCLILKVTRRKSGLLEQATGFSSSRMPGPWMKLLRIFAGHNPAHGELNSGKINHFWILTLRLASGKTKRVAHARSSEDAGSTWECPKVVGLINQRMLFCGCWANHHWTVTLLFSHHGAWVWLTVASFVIKAILRV